MAIDSDTGKLMNTETQQTPAPRILVGRQPIFDRNLDVYAYELLFRDEQTGNLCLERDGDMATSRTILNAFMEIDLERLTNGRPAFLNLTRGFFTEIPPSPSIPTLWCSRSWRTSRWTNTWSSRSGH